MKFLKRVKSLLRDVVEEVQFRADIARRTRLTGEFRVLIGKIFVAVVVVSIVVSIEGVALWWVTPSGDQSITTPADGIYYIIPNIFGETTAPQSFWARVVTLIALVEGVILTTYLIAVSAFFTVRGGKILTRKHAGHYVICGWNFQGERIVEELIAARIGDKHYDIVIIPGDPAPSELAQFGNKVFVVDGSPTEDSTLIRAGIETAKSAIVLNDTTKDADSADATVLLITLAIEDMNRSVYTCAQIQHSANEIHLARADVDETIPLDLIGANLAVASALNPGVTRVVNELIHFDSGSEFYKILATDIPKAAIGKTFSDTQSFFSDRGMILIGVESHKLEDSYLQSRATGFSKAGLAVNPRTHIIGSKDSLYVISENKPDPDSWDTE